MKRLITMTTIAVLGLGVASAHANVREQLPKEGDSTPTSTGNPSGCVLPTWTKQPRIVIHTATFNRGGAAAGDEAKMVDAIKQVADQFSDTPDLSARITSVTTTTDPYYWDTWLNDSVPTIHVRFSPQSAITEDNHGDPAGGLTKTNANGGCTISEAHIEFPQPTDADWDYGTPNEAGERWYDPGETFGDNTWFRPSFLHEMLHAFGFKHVQSIYSFMNHRFPAGFPWAGGGDDGGRMLPWELGTLRDAYGDNGASYAVGLRNGWVAPPQPDDNAS